MPRCFDQPTSNSASRTTNTGSREQPAQSSTIRTRQGRYEVPATTQAPVESKPAQPRRRPTNRTSSDIPYQPDEAQTPGPSRKPPAYLQGKNPYGHVLAKVEHPYRESGAAASTSVEPPAEIGTDVQGRLRGSGAVQDNARPAPVKPEPERIGNASNSRPPPLPLRQPPKPVSVQAAKNFFETKASQDRSAPPLPPASAAIITSGTTARNPQSPMRSRPQPVRPPSPVKAGAPRRRTSDAVLRPSDFLPNTEQTTSAEPIGTLKSLQAGKSLPDVIVRRATTFTDDPLAYNHLEADEEYPGATGRRRSTNIFINASHDVGNPSFEQEHANDIAKASDRSHRTEPRRSSEETVRRHRTRRSSSANELESMERSRKPEVPQQPQRSKIVQDSCKGYGEPDISSSRRLRRQSSRSAPLADMSTASDQAVRNARRRFSKSSATDADTSQLISGKSSGVRQKVEAIAAKGLSHDGSGSLHSLSRHSTASGSLLTADVGAQDDYHTIEVPSHIDSRGAYGRRTTQDFGFPGARIKPRRTVRPYKPLQDPSNWVKRTCGHFSYMGKGEVSELATKKRCRQCSVKSAPPTKSQQTHCGRSRKQAASDSSNSTSLSLTPSEGSGARARRRRHHSECLPSDKCGDTFAEDLGLIIDSILEEHASTLQGVINNIKHSQPSLVQLRRVSQDLVQRSQTTGVCTNPRHTPCRPQCTQQAACQPVCKPQICEWMPPCPYVPPKATEKLNVGSPGQIVPNVNDSRASLRESVTSVPELVNLVNSAADDLGLDLDRRPTAKDDELFQDAPYEKTPRASISSHQAYPLEDVGEGLTEENRSSEDPWLQQTRRHLTELSEARTQLMDELDLIAENLGVQPQDRHASEAQIDHVQKVLSKVNTGISRKSTRLRNKSVDSVAEEIPKMIDQQISERRLSRVLTRISTQSRRMSAITQNMQNIGEIPPEEIQAWLEVAQTELPAAIDSITTVLETLPALDFESADDMEVQPRYEEEYEPQYYSYPEPQYADVKPESYEDYAESPPRRTYTEPINELQDRISDLERRLRKGSMTTSSPQIEKDDFVTPLERKLSTSSTETQSPVQIMAAEDIAEDTTEDTIYSPIQVTATRRSTLPSRRATVHRQSQGERSVSAEQHDYEEIENLSESDIPPTFERVGERRTSTIRSAQSYMQPERTFSFVSPDPSAVEQPSHHVSQQPTNTDLNIPVQRPTRRRTSVAASPVLLTSTSPELGPVRRKSSIKAPVPSRQPTIEPDLPHPQDDDEFESNTDKGDRVDSFEPPVERTCRSTTSSKINMQLRPIDSPLATPSIQSSAPEDNLDIAPSSRKSTRQATRKASLPEVDLEIPAVKMARSLTQPIRQPTLREPEIEFEPPRLTVARSINRDSRRSTLTSPSPTSEEFIEDLPMSRIVTCHTTRSSTAAIVIEAPEEDIEVPLMRVRRTMTQPPPPPSPSPEPEPELEPELEIVTRRGTETIHLARGITRTSTRQRSESAEDPPAPPSSPSTESEIVLPSRIVIKHGSPLHVDGDEEVKPPALTTRIIGIATRRQSLAPDLLQRRKTGSMPRQSSARQPSVQYDQLALLESSLSSASKVLLDPTSKTVPQPEEFDAPVHGARQPTTVYEPPSEEIMPELAFTSRKPSFRPSPSITRLMTGPTRQSTVAERRATFEDALNVSSRRTMIISDPATTDTSPELAPIVSARYPSILDPASTQQSSRRPTRRTTEAESIPLPVSRQSTMLSLDAPSRRSTTWGESTLVQRNVDEPEVEVEVAAVTTRQPTRRSSRADSIPLPISREATVQRPRSVSRGSSAYSLSELSLRSVKTLPDEKEPELSRQLTQQPTSVGGVPTRRPTEPIVVEPEFITHRSMTRQRTTPTEPYLPDMSTPSSRQATAAGPTRQSTLIQTEEQSPSEVEVAFSSSSSSFEAQPVSSRVLSTRDRQMTTVDRKDTLLKGLSRVNTRLKPAASAQEPSLRSATKALTYAETSSIDSGLEWEPEDPDPDPIRRATTRRTTIPSQPQRSVATKSTPASRQTTIAKAPTSTIPELPYQIVRHETQSGEPDSFDETIVPSGSESDFAPEVPPMVEFSPLHRLSTQHSEDDHPNPPSRKSTWSMEAVLEEELPPRALSRKATGISRHTTRQATRKLTMGSRQPTVSGRAPSPDIEESLAEEWPAPVTEKALRQPTQMSRYLTVREDSPSTTMASRAPTQLSKTTTIRVGSTSALATIGTTAETTSESKIEPDAEFTESSPGSVDEEPAKVSRKPRRVPTKLPEYIDDDDDEPSLRRTPARPSRQIAKLPTQHTMRGTLEPDTRTEPTPQLEFLDSSTQSSPLEERFAAYDVYRGPVVQSADALTNEPSPVVQRTTTVRGPIIDYTPSPLVTPPRQQATSFSRLHPEVTDAEGTSSEPPLVAETVERESEQQSVMAAEEIPEEEPGRVDRAPTAGLSRDPESLAPPLARKDAEISPTTSSPLQHRKTRIDPKVDERVPRILTVPRERDRRRSSAAPGIVAPAAEGLPKSLKSALPAHKSKRMPDYPPDQQYPPAPAYPHRETPSWTRPDTQTPPPKSVVEDAPKKRRFLGIRSKAKDKPVQRPPGPHRDRDSVEPFRHAAPGPVPGPPGGTLQRPRGYTNRPGNIIYHRTPAPIPIRRDDYPPRQAPIYARKDDYFPRLTPIIRDRRNDRPRPQSAPIPRDVQPQYPRAQAPARKHYPPPARRDYPARNYVPLRREYQQAQPRGIPYRNEPRQQPLRRHAAESIRHQPQAQQAPRNKEKVPPRSKAASSQRRPQNHQEPSRTRSASQKEDFNGPARRVAHSATSEEDAVPKKEPGQSRGKQTQTGERGVYQPQQQEEQQAGRESSHSTAQRKDANRRPAKFSEIPLHKPQKEAPQQEREKEQRRKSARRGGEPSSADQETKGSSRGISGNGSSLQLSRKERETPVSDSIDGASFRSSLELQLQPSAARIDVPRASTQSPSTTGRHASTQSQADRRRRSSAKPEQEKPIPRTLSRQATARRASEATNSAQTARQDSSAGTRRPSTALEKSRAQDRSSIADASFPGRSSLSRTIPSRTNTTPSRTPTVGISARKTGDRRPSTTTAAPIARAADSRAEGARLPNSEPRQSAPGSPAAKLGSGPRENEKTVNDPSNSAPEPKKSTLPRVTPAKFDESDSGDPIPLVRARVGDRKTFEGQGAPPAPAKRTPSFFGRGKGQADSGVAQSGWQGAGADKRQHGGKDESKVGQGGPSKGRWGWGWGKG